MTGAATDSPLKDKLVLVVDDEPDLRDILKESISAYGANVIEAPNGRAAFELVEQNPVDVVVTDVRMPGGNGIELLEKIKSRADRPLVMMMSGYSDLTIEEAYNRGADALFGKPFDVFEICAALERALTPEAQPRRSSPRMAVGVEVKLRFPAPLPPRTGRLLNISQGGMFVQIPSPHPPTGSQVSFHVMFSEGPFAPINGDGVVKWSVIELDESRSGLGIEFTRLDNTKGDSQVLARRKP